MESEEDATMHPLHIHDSTDLFITLCKHGTVPEKQTCQCVCICVHANIFGVLQCHTWTVFRASEDRIDISDEFTARWSARGAKQGDLFHSPPHTHFQILAHCVCHAHYRSTVPLAPDSAQQTQWILTCTPAIASLKAKCPQSFGQECVNGYIYMHPYTVIKAMLQFSWNTVIMLMWLCSVTIIGIQYVDYCCFNGCIRACICYKIMHACITFPQ